MRTCTSFAPASRSIRTRALGVTANDGVVNDDEALTCNHRLERVQLRSITELADSLRGLNEGSTHVGVLDQAVTVGMPDSSA